jgi:hypothetical protein
MYISFSLSLCLSHSLSLSVSHTLGMSLSNYLSHLHTISNIHRHSGSRVLSLSLSLSVSLYIYLSLSLSSFFYKLIFQVYKLILWNVVWKNKGFIFQFYVLHQIMFGYVISNDEVYQIWLHCWDFDLLSSSMSFVMCFAIWRHHTDFRWSDVRLKRLTPFIFCCMYKWILFTNNCCEICGKIQIPFSVKLE